MTAGALEARLLQGLPANPPPPAHPGYFRGGTGGPEYLAGRPLPPGGLPRGHLQMQGPGPYPPQYSRPAPPHPSHPQTGYLMGGGPGGFQPFPSPPPRATPPPSYPPQAQPQQQGLLQTFPALRNLHRGPVMEGARPLLAPTHPSHPQGYSPMSRGGPGGLPRHLQGGGPGYVQGSAPDPRSTVERNLVPSSSSPGMGMGGGVRIPGANSVSTLAGMYLASTSSSSSTTASTTTSLAPAQSSASRAPSWEDADIPLPR
eukprot:RCo038034